MGLNGQDGGSTESEFPTSLSYFHRSRQKRTRASEVKRQSTYGVRTDAYLLDLYAQRVMNRVLHQSQVHKSDNPTSEFCDDCPRLEKDLEETKNELLARLKK